MRETATASQYTTSSVYRDARHLNGRPNIYGATVAEWNGQEGSIMYQQRTIYIDRGE